jgi:signal transduction histidine kinase
MPQVLQLWAWLTRPYPGLEDIQQRRQARLLAQLLLGCIVFLIASISLTLLLSSQRDTLYDYIPAVGLLSLLCLGCYLLNRNGYLQLSAYLVVLGLFFALHGMTVYLHDVTGEFYALLPLLLAALLLPSGAVLILFFADIVIELTIWAFLPMTTWFTNLGTLSFLVVLAPLVILFIYYRNGLEGERQTELQETNRKLRISEETLEKRVEERTRDLQIAREQAEQANAIKSQFLAAVSHELRTPLNAIINLSEFLHDEIMGPMNTDQQTTAQNVVNSGRHLLALINDVLDISKIESGALQLFIEDAVDITAELYNLEATTRTLVTSPEVAVVLEIPEPLPLVRGDRLRLRQILLNLVSNASKFTDHGTITIRATRQGEDIQVVVKDTGPGIRPEDQDAIFETFRQTDVGLRKGKGTGLGLPIARKLAEAHGGKLTVESEPGHGASFIVTLPVRAVHLVPSLAEA